MYKVSGNGGVGRANLGNGCLVSMCLMSLIDLAPFYCPADFLCTEMHACAVCYNNPELRELPGQL